MKDFKIAGKAIDRLADKVRALSGTQKVEQILAETVALTQESIIDKISGNDGTIRPHDRDGETVTDLVDTGAYRASWQISFPAPGVGRVSTNSEYAAKLEYGDENMPGFYVARDTARKMKRELIRKLNKHIKETLK